MPLQRRLDFTDKSYRIAQSPPSHEGPVKLSEGFYIDGGSDGVSLKEITTVKEIDPGREIRMERRVP
jgi:hypothetical protein